LFGAQIGKSIRLCLEYHSGEPEPLPQEESEHEHKKHASIDRSLRFATWAVLGASIIAFIALSSVLSEHNFKSIPLACIGGAVGACLRFLVSTKINPKRPNFPLGTFLCNILGSLAYIAVVVALRLRTSDLCVLLPLFPPLRLSPNDSPNYRFIIDIVSSVLLLGFAGGLTTVSSFVLEIHSLNPGPAWIYGGSTIIVTQVVLLAVNGAFVLVTT
jgi:fluoride exporter